MSDGEDYARWYDFGEGSEYLRQRAQESLRKARDEQQHVSCHGHEALLADRDARIQELESAIANITAILRGRREEEREDHARQQAGLDVLGVKINALLQERDHLRSKVERLRAVKAAALFAHTRRMAWKAATGNHKATEAMVAEMVAAQHALEAACADLAATEGT